ncbi:MAG: hypothetical protein P9L98_00670 [Candidatus Kaelpia imicola]|nr:hypothetical protein [Candidatus Kaelpia imicola]
MKTLDEKNIELSKMLFSLKHSIDLEKLFGLNADIINKVGVGKKFFVHIRMILKESFVMSIYKIFEKEKTYSLNSIPAILELIKSKELNCKYPDYVDEFISKYENGKKGTNYIEALEAIYESFYSKHQASFERYDYARDKVVAHSEYKAQRDLLPSHAVMKEVLLFGVDFNRMISEAFLGVGPHPIASDMQVSSSLCRLLEELGYKNIKKEFDK